MTAVSDDTDLGVDDLRRVVAIALGWTDGGAYFDQVFSVSRAQSICEEILQYDEGDQPQRRAARIASLLWITLPIEPLRIEQAQSLFDGELNRSDSSIPKWLNTPRLAITVLSGVRYRYKNELPWDLRNISSSERDDLVGDLHRLTSIFNNIADPLAKLTEVMDCLYVEGQAPRVGEIELVEAAPTSSADATPVRPTTIIDRAPQGRRSSYRWVALASTVAALLAAGLTAWVIQSRTATATATPVAVAVTTNMPPDYAPDTDYAPGFYPDRAIHADSDTVSGVLLNSVINNPAWPDERQFLSISNPRIDPGNALGTHGEVTAKTGDTLKLRGIIHNIGDTAATGVEVEPFSSISASDRSFAYQWSISGNEFDTLTATTVVRCVEACGQAYYNDDPVIVTDDNGVELYRFSNDEFNRGVAIGSKTPDGVLLPGTTVFLSTPMHVVAPRNRTTSPSTPTS